MCDLGTTTRGAYLLLLTLCSRITTPDRGSGDHVCALWGIGPSPWPAVNYGTHPTSCAVSLASIRCSFLQAGTLKKLASKNPRCRRTFQKPPQQGSVEPVGVPRASPQVPDWSLTLASNCCMLSVICQFITLPPHPISHIWADFLRKFPKALSESESHSGVWVGGVKTFPSPNPSDRHCTVHASSAGVVGSRSPSCLDRDCLSLEAHGTKPQNVSLRWSLKQRAWLSHPGMADVG